MSTTQTRIDREASQLIIERVFSAPRPLVFSAFSKAEHLVNWWGPKGWTLPVCNIDFREDGVWHYCMKGPNAEESWGKAVYHDIHAPEYFTYTDYFSDSEGNVSDEMPAANIRVEFHEQPDGKTKIVSIAHYQTIAEIDSLLAMGMVEGITETWDRLEEFLVAAASTPTTITITRLLDAPRPLVWTAHNDPKHIIHWCSAGDGWTTPFAEVDLRPGGVFRIGFGSPDGKNDFVYEGVYGDVVEPERVVQILGDNRKVVTTFIEVDGKTEVTIVLDVESESSAELQRHGWSAILANFARHVATL